MCEKGVDEELGYKPEWLIPLIQPPFHGARIGGQINSTCCGLRVNPKMQVIGTDAHVIKGLYANFHTAGGITGTCCISGGQFGGDLIGNVGISYTSGYMAAVAACEEARATQNV